MFHSPIHRPPILNVGALQVLCLWYIVCVLSPVLVPVHFLRSISVILALMKPACLPIEKWEIPTDTQITTCVDLQHPPVITHTYTDSEHISNAWWPLTVYNWTRRDETARWLESSETKGSTVTLSLNLALIFPVISNINLKLYFKGKIKLIIN